MSEKSRYEEVMAAPMESVGWHGSFPILRISGLIMIMSTDDDFGDGHCWKHLSVSTADRTPSYDELLAMRDRFFAAESEVIQVFPPREEHRNAHPHCLHLWSRSVRLCPKLLADAVAPRGASPQIMASMGFSRRR